VVNYNLKNKIGKRNAIDLKIKIKFERIKGYEKENN